jgi:hypothetical protein
MFAQLDSKGEKHDYSGDPSGRPALSTTQIAVIFCETSNLTKEVIVRLIQNRLSQNVDPSLSVEYLIASAG